MGSRLRGNDGCLPTAVRLLITRIGLRLRIRIGLRLCIRTRLGLLLFAFLFLGHVVAYGATGGCAQHVVLAEEVAADRAHGCAFQAAGLGRSTA